MRQLCACPPRLGGNGPGGEVGMGLPPQARQPNAPATMQGRVLTDSTCYYDVCAAERASHPEVALDWIPLSWRDENQHGPWGSRFV